MEHPISPNNKNARIDFWDFSSTNEADFMMEQFSHRICDGLIIVVSEREQADTEDFIDKTYICPLYYLKMKL